MPQQLIGSSIWVKMDSQSPTAREKINIEGLGKVADLSAEGWQKSCFVPWRFDLVHMGHVRHLEAARREGDVLFVTVTGDDYVNKGLAALFLVNRCERKCLPQYSMLIELLLAIP